MHPILAHLFDAWDEIGLTWCLLRGAGDLAAPSGDVDLLLASHDLSAAQLAAERLGFVRVPGRRHGLHLLQFDRATASWLWLHIVSDLTFGPFRALATGAAGECLANRRRAGGVAILAPGDEFWVLLFHCLLDRGAIAPRHCERLRTLAATAASEGRLAEMFRSVAPAGWTFERVMYALERNASDEIATLGASMAAAVRTRAAIGVVTRAARRLRRAADVVGKVRVRRGVSVALLGPDGAGKSTLAAGLEASSVFPVRHVYMGLTGGMLRYVDKLRVPGIVRAGRLLVLWGRYARAQYHQARGRLVIFDRYIYDAEVPTPYRLSRMGRMARWMDGRSCPPPDLVIVLDAPGEVMHRRKGEYTPEMLEEWRQRFRAIGRRVAGVEIVDATQPTDTVRAEVLDRIWRRYAARWGAP